MRDVSERGGKGGSEATSINSCATVLCVAEPELLRAVPNEAVEMEGGIGQKREREREGVWRWLGESD